MTSLCNLNGQILREEEARISVLDRGFLFGDSVYEAMRTRDGVPFAWPEHLARLRASAAGIALELDLDDREIMARLKATLAQRGDVDSYIRIVVTRGVGSAPNIDLAHAPGPPTYVILVRDLLPTATRARLAVIPRLRTDRRALDPAIKSGNYLNNLLGLAEAKARGATDCLFLNQQGEVTEASTSNFYLVRDGEVRTPALSAGLLEGTTRRLLIGFCADRGHPLVESSITEADLAEADEMFLSSTLRDLVPVVEVGGRPIGDGEPGPHTMRLLAEFIEYCRERTREIYAPEYARI